MLFGENNMSNTFKKILKIIFTITAAFAMFFFSYQALLLIIVIIIFGPGGHGNWLGFTGLFIVTPFLVGLVSLIISESKYLEINEQ
jgi:hypothetical protein